jgi:hypothetical protein
VTSLEDKIENLGAIAIENIKAKADAEHERDIYKRCLEYILQQTTWRDQTHAIAAARQILREMK